MLRKKEIKNRLTLPKKKSKKQKQILSWKFGPLFEQFIKQVSLILQSKLKIVFLSQKVTNIDNFFQRILFKSKKKKKNNILTGITIGH